MKTDAVAGFDKDHIANIDKAAVAGFGKDHFSKMDKTAVAGFDKDHMANLKTDAVAGFDKDHIANIDKAAVAGFGKDHIGNLDKEAVKGFDREKIVNISKDAFTGFKVDQVKNLEENSKKGMGDAINDFEKIDVSVREELVAPEKRLLGGVGSFLDLAKSTGDDSQASGWGNNIEKSKGFVTQPAADGDSGASSTSTDKVFEKEETKDKVKNVFSTIKLF
ncbi:MAG: hypothetical protein FI697_07430 [SAR202 cluster bacterium]|nr:hypothetical protein [SAR202 cluster bacterium]